MKKLLFIISISIIGMFILSGCGKQYTCSECNKKTREIYYDVNGNADYCAKCAKKYWAPFNYKNYRAD